MKDTLGDLIAYKLKMLIFFPDIQLFPATENGRQSGFQYEIDLLAQLLVIVGWQTGINTGLDKMRLSAPVPAGARVRLHAEIKDARVVGAGASPAKSPGAPARRIRTNNDHP